MVRSPTQARFGFLTVLIPDLEPQGIEIHDRIHGFQRPLLPLIDLGQHFIGDGGNPVRRHIQPTQLQRVILDLARHRGLQALVRSQLVARDSKPCSRAGRAYMLMT
jgi:hypothetical protein